MSLDDPAVGAPGPSEGLRDPDPTLPTGEGSEELRMDESAGTITERVHKVLDALTMADWSDGLRTQIALQEGLSLLAYLAQFERHVVILQEHDFVIEHPLSERERGEMADCNLIKWIVRNHHRYAPGRYVAQETASGWRLTQ